MSDNSRIHRKRAPAGVVLKRPLQVYLLPREVHAFDSAHAETTLTRSAFARLVHLAGMQLLATDPDRVLRAGP